MANLASSGQISLDDIIKNRTGAAGTNISLKDESETFASGSEVDGSSDQTTARRNLDIAPYAMSEFHNADFNTDIIESITVTTEGGGGDTDSVDGEDVIIAFVTDGETGTYTVQFLNTGGSIIGSDTVTVSSGTNGSVTFGSLAVNAATYRARVKKGFATQDDDATFTHHKAIGAVSVTDPSDTTVAASSTEHEITHARSIANTTSLNDYNWTFATTTGGDDGGNPNPTTSTASTPTVTYTGPGTYTAVLRVDGTPSQARNSTTAATVTHTIEYTDSITANDQSTGKNEGTTITCVGTHKGIAGGIKIGYVNVSDTGTFLASDTSDSTDSRFQASDLVSKGVTAASLGASTISCKIRAEDKAASSTNDLSDNAFNVYPLVSQELASGDISVSVDPVIVGANTVLSVANITDNIVGYNWAMTSGAGSMTSNNASGGDTDGTSVDGTSIIDETSAATNTVSFNSAQSSKTITLTLYGRISQTATATKTLSVELANALTVGGMITAFDSNSVTISGSQAGYSGGVTFGVVSASAATALNISSPNSRDDTTDSRYSSDNYSGAFTLPTDTVTRQYRGYVIDKGDSTGEDEDTATFTVYPRIIAARNTINASRNIIYSSTRASDTSTYPPTVSYQTPGSPTDNVTAYAYSAGTSLTGHGFSAASSATTTYGGGSGVGASTTTLTITGTGHPGNQTSTTTHAVTVNYEPRVYDITFTSGTIIQASTTLYIKSITWQGFDASDFTVSVFSSSGGGGSEVGSASPVTIEDGEGGAAELEDNCLDNDTGGTQKTGTLWTHGTGVSCGTISTSGTVYLRVESNGGHTYEESITVAAWNNVSITGYDEGEGAGIQTYDNQEDASRGIPPDGDPSTVTVYYLGTLGTTDPVTLKASIGGSAYNGQNGWWDMTGGYIGYIASNGEITAANYIADANAQPKAPTSITFTSVTTTQIVIGWTDNSAIEDGFKVYMNTGGTADSGDTLINTASANATSYTKGSLSAGTTYYFAVYAYNGSALSSVLQGSQATAANRTLATNDSASALDTWANQTNTYKYSDAFVLTLANTQSNDKILITVTHSGDTLSDITTKIAVNKDNNNPPYNSNGATPDGTSVQESGNVGGATTLTFSSLSSGTNYFTCQIEGLSDGTVNASGIETATFTVTAIVKDSGDSTVIASATYHTYQQKMNPFA